MSLFAVIVKHALPEQFRQGIDPNDKVAIANKLIVETFLTHENLLYAGNFIKDINLLARYRLVDGWDVTSKFLVPSDEEAQQLKSLIEQLALRNANDIGRTWKHPDSDVIQVEEISDNDILDFVTFNSANNVDPGVLNFPN